MQEIPEKLAAFAEGELRGRGIEIRTSTTLDRVTEHHAYLSDGEQVPTRTLVWTAGVKPQPVVAKLGLPLTDRGRIVSDKLHAGRRATTTSGRSATAPRSPTPRARASRARRPRSTRSARGASSRTTSRRRSGPGGRKRAFKYKTKGVFVDMGRREAVAMTGPITWSGTPAWILARSYHLAAMPGMGRRARLLVDWNIGLLFGRDTAELGGVAAVKPPEPGRASPRSAPAARRERRAGRRRRVAAEPRARGVHPAVEYRARPSRASRRAAWSSRLRRARGRQQTAARPA